MDVHASLDARCPPDVLFERVGSLDTYDEWLEIVPRTTPAPAVDGDPGPAWHVTLRGSLGPFARSKRLRMVRTRHEAPTEAVFERRETDGRQHSPWILSARVSGTSERSTLAMDLHYGGSLWVPLLDRLLAAEIESSRERLRLLVETPDP